MVVFTENFWNFKGDDGRKRTHVPPTPYWIALVRVAQLALALLVLILTAVTASKIGSDIASLGITWFTFAWTLLHLGWLFISILVVPSIYNYWAQLAVESLSVIFWLASWAALAGQTSGEFLGRTNAFYEGLACARGAAGMGALVWLLFVVTLVFFVMNLLRFRKANKASPTTEAGYAHEQKPLGGGAEVYASPVGTEMYPPVQVVPQQQQYEAHPQQQHQAPQGYVQQQ